MATASYQPAMSQCAVLWLFCMFCCLCVHVLRLNLYSGITELPANQALGIENRIFWIHGCLKEVQVTCDWSQGYLRVGGLIFGSFTDETLSVGECHVARRCSCACSHVLSPRITRPHQSKRKKLRLPWSLAIISTFSFFMMPTHEYVVPKSIPTHGPSNFVPAAAINEARKSLIAGV